MTKSLSALMLETGSADPSSVADSKAWYSNCAELVATARGSASTAMAVRLQDFCTAFRALGANVSKEVMDAVAKNGGAALDFCANVVTDLFPKIFQVMSGHFLGACLQKQSWWVDATRARVLPDETSAAGRDVFKRAAEYSLPAEQLACLKAMAEAFAGLGMSIDNDKMQSCTLAYSTAVILHSASTVLDIKLNGTWVGENCDAATLLATVNSVQKPVMHLCKGVAQLAQVLEAAKLDDILKGVQPVVEAVFKE